MKKRILTTLISVILVTPVALSAEKKLEITPATTITITRSNAEVRNEISRLNIRRMLMANALRLSDTQKEQAKAILKDGSEKEALLSIQLRKEEKKYDELSNTKASLKAKSEQKKTIKKIENELKKIRKENEKAFVKILTKQQKYKYKSLKTDIER